MAMFLVDYNLPDGRQFSAELQADSFQDAEAHLDALVTTGRIEGELYERGEVDTNQTISTQTGHC